MKTAIHRGLCLPANYLLLFLILFSWSSLNSQILENFETETTGATTFSEGGISFNTLTPLAVQFFENGGGNG